jgi:cytochrome d ubiquinol oxidase subunit II
MLLKTLPMVFALAGLALYTVLGGADFGAGIWQLTAGRGSDGERLRGHAHHVIGPVWEANHVWLIFVLTVIWTSYPLAFGSIASTLSLPLFIAGLGIIMRGAAYALRSGAQEGAEMRRVDTAFAIASLLTPFALGATVGGIAGGRVPVGNAAGDLFTSWWNPISIVIGVLAIVSAAYLAAVYLAADAVRLNDAWVERQFRARALATGVIAGAIAIAGLFVVHADAHHLGDRLVDGPGLPALIVSVLAGVCTLGLVWWRRYEAARVSAALAVVAIIVGWALAQQPLIIPGLTIARAAAPHDTLVLVVIAVLAGAAILFPSLALLFGLFLRGRFDPGEEAIAAPAASPATASAPARAVLHVSRRALLARVAGACLLAGFGLLTIAGGEVEHAFGVVALLGAVVIGFFAVGPGELAARADGETD